MQQRGLNVVNLCQHPLSSRKACWFSFTRLPGLRASPYLLWVILCPRSAYIKTFKLKVAPLLQELRARGRLRPRPEKASLKSTEFQQLCALVQEVHGHW